MFWLSCINFLLVRSLLLTIFCDKYARLWSDFHFALQRPASQTCKSRQIQCAFWNSIIFHKNSWNWKKDIWSRIVRFFWKISDLQIIFTTQLQFQLRCPSQLLKRAHKRQNSINERVTSIIKFVFAAELENLSPQPPYYVRKKRSTCKNRRRQRAAAMC